MPSTPKKNGRESRPDANNGDSMPAGRSLTEEQQAAIERVRHGADVLKNIAVPAAMCSIFNLKTEVSPGGIKVFADDFIQEAGDPSDPLERTMVQHVLLAHGRLIQLHTQAAEAKTAEAMTLCNAAAARLTSEMRQLILAIKRYREPTGPRTTTVVHKIGRIDQQNVSGGDQAVSFSREDAPEGRVGMTCREIEMDGRMELPDEFNHIETGEESPSLSRRQTRCSDEGALDRRPT